MAEQTIAEIKQSAEQKMGKSLEALKNDLSKVRTGRASTGILDHVMVDYYGNPTVKRHAESKNRDRGRRTPHPG